MRRSRRRRLEPSAGPVDAGRLARRRGPRAALRAAVELLAKGPDAASEIGEAFLKGRALAIWRKALLAGPAASIDATLETLKQDDGLEACVSVAWMPASALAASPRRFVRLLGLNSSRWPRGIAEDRLIPDHIIPTPILDPLPVNLADRRDFETILATTAGDVVLSRARRDSDGRLLGRSPLLAGHGDETYLRRNAMPAHAFSETDRLMARPAGVRRRSASGQRAGLLARLAAAPRSPPMTGSCGRIIRSFSPSSAAPSRPVRCAACCAIRSASCGSMRSDGANRRAAPNRSCSTRSAIGDLVHMVLDRALRDLEAGGGLASADAETVEAAVARAAQAVAADWESERPVPPAVIWGRTLDDARVMAGRALSYGDDVLPGARSYGEVPFGGSEPKSDAETPWDASAPVTIPDTGFNIAGYIDRLDISGDGKRALVRDYKTGRPPRGDIRLNGGRELQRCLYAFAVKALLGDDVAISASLLYPREPRRSSARRSRGRARGDHGLSPRGKDQSRRRRGAALARIPAATMTTSPSPCRPTPAPPIANAKCRPRRSGSAKPLRSGRRNDEQRVQGAEGRRRAPRRDQPP